MTLSRRRCRGRGLYTSINERVTDDDVSVHVEMSVQRVDLMATEALSVQESPHSRRKVASERSVRR